MFWLKERHKSYKTNSAVFIIYMQKSIVIPKILNLKIHMFSDSIMSQGKLFQLLITRCEKKCFLQLR